MPEHSKDLLEFCRRYPLLKYDKGDILLHANTKHGHFLYVESGAVKMVTTSARGKNLVLHIFFQDTIISLLTLINNGVNKYDFTCLLPTTVRKIPEDELLHFLHENPEVLNTIHLRLLQAIQGLLERIEQTHFVPAYNQVAGILLYFSKHFSKSKNENGKLTIEARLTHQAIAEWLGLTRENVSIQMKLLERDKLISKRGSLVEICDVEKIKALSDPYMSPM